MSGQAGKHKWRLFRRMSPAASVEPEARIRGPWVSGSVAYGPVIQVSDTAGNVNIAVGTEKPLYRVDAFPDARAPLTVEQARARPALLLQARYTVVDFTGRRTELGRMAAWRDGTDAASVLLLHGSGGQGKSRLAAHFVHASHELGWQIFQARHASVPVPLLAQPGRTGDGPSAGLRGAGVLLVVDYAERWPATDLQEMLHDATLQERPARVLLLARSASWWWQTLVNRLDSPVLPTASLRLPPLADDPDTDPEALFTAARDRFATTLDAPGAREIAPPDALRKDPGFRRILAVHMAALAAVEAHRTAEPVTLDTPASVSASLLAREREHWRAMHANGHTETTVGSLARAVYTAALVGPVSHDQGRIALETIQACPSDGTDQVLRDHAVLYPSTSPHTVLEPLHPDWFAQDYLAFATPGHPDSSDTSDPWAFSAPAHLLATRTRGEKQQSGNGQKASAQPVWLRPAMTTLIETSRRWPHIATNQLLPLLRDHPHLALAAGTSLTAITSITQLPASFLVSLAANLLNTAQTLSTQDDSLEEALEAAHLAQSLYQHLKTPEHPATLDELQARGLSILSEIQIRVGQLEPAVQNTALALKIYQKLARNTESTYQHELANALYQHAQAVKRTHNGLHEALTLIRECLDTYKKMEEAHREKDQSFTPLTTEKLLQAKTLHANLLTGLDEQQKQELHTRDSG